MSWSFLEAERIKFGLWLSNSSCKIIIIVEGLKDNFMQREKEIKTTAHIDLGLVSDGLTGKRKSVPFP